MPTIEQPDRPAPCYDDPDGPAEIPQHDDQPEPFWVPAKEPAKQPSVKE